MLEVISTSGMAAKALTGLDIDLPVICRIGMEGDKLIATGGLCFGGGRAWIWFHVENKPTQSIAMQAIRQARTMMRKAAQLGETEVYTLRDATFETSERLCKMAGFEKTDEIVEGLEIWRHSL